MFASGSVAAYRTRRQRLAIMIDTVVVQQHIRSAILVIDIARVRCNVIICTKKMKKKKNQEKIEMLRKECVKKSKLVWC